jgi:hypothetical protein
LPPTFPRRRFQRVIGGTVVAAILAQGVPLVATPLLSTTGIAVPMAKVGLHAELVLKLDRHDVVTGQIEHRTTYSVGSNILQAGA